MRSNGSFDADTHRQGAASLAREHTSPCRCMPINADVKQPKEPPLPAYVVKHLAYERGPLLGS